MQDPRSCNARGGANCSAIRFNYGIENTFISACHCQIPDTSQPGGTLLARETQSGTAKVSQWSTSPLPLPRGENSIAILGGFWGGIHAAIFGRLGVLRHVECRPFLRPGVWPEGPILRKAICTALPCPALKFTTLPPYSLTFSSPRIDPQNSDRYLLLLIACCLGRFLSPPLLPVFMILLSTYCSTVINRLPPSSPAPSSR